MSIYKLSLNKKRCIACFACEIHCQNVNGAPPEVRIGKFSVSGPAPDKDGRPVLSAKYAPCMHCKKPGCVPACPTKALYIRESDGLVLLDAALCNGCGECIPACPFDHPRLNPALGKIMKCDYCQARIDAGLMPACVTGCTAKALTFGAIPETQKK
ncbi:MAG: 4Fe-4S binding protein [Desulfovibrionaceae bacterium]|nr:4Fe-4S binding protein [Desulfovibrionaceae bacterium]MBF0515400.1 4Fe-4S binding protein [Desulfovibrionaceae bacterium]